MNGEFLNRISQAWVVSENSQEPFAVTFGLDLDGAEMLGLDCMERRKTLRPVPG
jgi:hypothetical protein